LKSDTAGSIVVYLQERFGVTPYYFSKDMKNLIITTCILLIGSTAYSQSTPIDIRWGEAFKSKRGMITDIISTRDGQMYAVKEHFGMFNSGVFIEKYADLSPVKSRELKYEVPKDGEMVKEVIALGDQLWVLNLTTSFKHATLTAEQVDMDHLSIAASDERIFELDIERRMRYSYGGYDFNINEAKDKLGMVIQYPGSRDEACVLNFQVRDEDMGIIWDKDVQFNYVKEMVDIYGVKVDADGTIYTLLKVYDPRSEGSSKRGKTHTYRLVQQSEFGEMKEAVLNVDGQLIQHIDLSLQEDGSIILGGYYGMNCCTVKGAFHAKINSETMDVKQLVATDYSLDFIAEGYGSKMYKKMERKKEGDRPYGFDKIDFREFIVTDDGGLLLVGEQYDVAIEASNQKTMHDQSSSHFNYKDIIVTRLNADGSLAWTQKILKSQMTGEDAGLMSGYVMAELNGNYFFIFNDHKDNMGIQSAEEIKAFTRRKKDAVLAMVTIRQDGSMYKDILFKQKELPMEIRPHSCEQVSENELILFGMSKSKNQFARVTLQDAELNVSLP
jgi:hypothetical protein